METRCRECYGTGIDENGQPCYLCNGLGAIDKCECGSKCEEGCSCGIWEKIYETP